MGLFRKSIKPEDYLFDLYWPYTPVQQEDYAEESFTFKQIYLQYVQLMAQGWFGEGELSLQQVFRDSRDVDLDKIIPQRPEGEKSLFDSIGVQSALLNTQVRFDNAERISWNDSKLAKTWQNKLESLGVTLFYMQSPQNSSIQIVFGPWTLFDNETPLPVMGEAWRDKSTNREFIYWFIDALSKTRYSKPTKDLHPTHAFYMPAMFQRIGYVSETIFPSSMVRVRDRKAEFGVASLSEIPPLAFHTVRDYVVLTLVKEEGSLTQRQDWSPETTRYGYLIDESIPFLGENDIIPKVVDALPKAASILMDGYCNWTDVGEISFQDELFLDYDLKEAQLEPFELGFFVPGTAYGRLIWKSMVYYSAITNLSNDEKTLSKDPNAKEILTEGFWRLINRGCGSIPMHSVNSFFFDHLKNNPKDIANSSDSDKSLYRRIMTYFSHYRVDDQDSNVLSNLACFESTWGDHVQSLNVIELGLEKLSKPSVYYHIEIWPPNEQVKLPIRLELLITKAKVKNSLGQTNEAKALLTQVIEESNFAGFTGAEYQEALTLLNSMG